jgi:hypothetical protein
MKRLVFTGILLITALAVLPVGPALAGGLPTDPIITADACVLTVEFDAQVPGIYTVDIWDDGKIIQSQSQAGAFFGDTLVFQFFIYEFGTVAKGVGVAIMKDGNWLSYWEVGGFEPECFGALAAGCNPRIPEGSVVGQVLENTLAYWAPSMDATTSTVLPIGTTWWVIGTDDSKTWYQVMVSCQAVWVPARMMGPNPDAVWNSAPLPAVASEEEIAPPPPVTQIVPSRGITRKPAPHP